MYKSQLQKIDPYDWFCGSGSQIWKCEERVKGQKKVREKAVLCIDILIYFCCCNNLLAGKLEYIKDAAFKIHNPATDLLHVENVSLKSRDICYDWGLSY